MYKINRENLVNFNSLKIPLNSLAFMLVDWSFCSNTSKVGPFKNSNS